MLSKKHIGRTCLQGAILGIMWVLSTHVIFSEVAPIPLHPASFQLTVYFPTTLLTKGDTMNVVVEILNLGKENLKISELVELDQIITPKPGEKDEPKYVDTFGEKDPADELHLRMECILPADTQRRRFLTQRPGRYSLRLHEVSANESLFIKVVLPQDAFEEGICSYRIMDRKGLVRAITKCCG